MDTLATTDPASILDLAGTLAQAFGWTLYLYVLPGLVLLSLFYDNSSLALGERLTLSIGIGASVYPLLYLWANTAGLPAGPWAAWMPGALSALYLLWQVVARRDARLRHLSLPRDRTIQWTAVLAAGFVLTLAVSRFLPVQSMTAPAWGDSVHHTLIVQLLLENSGLFQSWPPYAPIESFTYHFGFHANMAVWATVTGQDAAQAVITGGQLLNVLAVLALYPLAVRLGGSRWAGVAAVFVAGLLSMQPGNYVNWGRYTQLAGQVILPAWLWAMDVWWTERKRPSARFLPLIVLLAAGLALTHYRVAIVAACAAAAWGLWSLWLLRARWQDWLARALWLALTAGAALVLVLPWLLTVRAGRLSYVVGAIAQRSADPSEAGTELAAWREVAAYYAPYLEWVATGALAAALWKRRSLAVPLLLWGALAFLAANPFIAGMGGTGIVTNFLLVIALYIPFSLLIGWLIAEAWRLAQSNRVAGIAFAIGLLAIGVVGFRQQATIVDPFYQMVTPADRTAFAWAEENTPAGSRFLVNAFPAYNDTVVVGSDGGWWLPFYTKRFASVPPILYSTERLSPDVDRDAIRQLVFDVQASQGRPQALSAVLCQYDLTHVYLGDRQGGVGFGDTQLIKPEWLRENPDFALLHETGAAQVWSFDHGVCDPRAE